MVDNIATPIRPRLTATPTPGVARATVPGGVDDLAALAAAVGVVLGAADGVDDPVVAVATPDGLVACPFDLTEGDPVAQVAAALAEAVPVSAHGAVVVGEGQADGAALRIASSDGQLRGEVDTAVAEVWFAETFLRAVAAQLSAVEEALAADRARTTEFGASAFEVRTETTVVAPILDVAQRHPSRPAVIAGVRTMTYGELVDHAGDVARELARRGIGAGDRVAVLTGKSPHAIPAILGVLLAGAAYVPLDPQSPPARVATVLADADCRAVLADPACPVAETSTPWIILPVPGDMAHPLPPAPTPADPAYVIYTSGSTGGPKGVEVRHSAIASFLRWKVDAYGLDHDTRLLQLPSLAFDSSVADVFSVLWAGGTLALAEISPPDPRRLADLVAQHRATHMTVVPSLYRLLVAELAGAPTTLRAVTVAGEAVPAELAAEHRAALPGVELRNEYGPTENSVAATSFAYGDDDGPGCCIGRPISNTAVLITDEDARPTPVGFVGEIRLAGPGLADGYLGRPDLTAEAFVPAPLLPGGRCYRTGDRGWWRPDGMIEFIGRVDGQVKIRGHRVEIAEVERALSTIDGVTTAVVVPVPDGAGTTLVGYLESTTADPAAAREWLGTVLSSAMVPTRIEVVTALPRLISGKPDRKALAAMAPAAQSTPDTPAEAPDLLTTVAAVFSEVLKIETVTPDDDFFALGGHSLSAVSAIRRLEDRLGVLVDLDDFLDAATVREVADHARRATAAPAADPTPVPTAGDNQALARFLT